MATGCSLGSNLFQGPNSAVIQQPVFPHKNYGEKYFYEQPFGVSVDQSLLKGTRLNTAFDENAWNAAKQNYGMRCPSQLPIWPPQFLMPKLDKKGQIILGGYGYDNPLAINPPYVEMPQVRIPTLPDGQPVATISTPSSPFPPQGEKKMRDMKNKFKI
jgi:hypothetical protein